MTQECRKRSVTGRHWEAALPLGRCPVSQRRVRSAHLAEDVAPGPSPSQAIKMIEGMESMSCEERLMDGAGDRRMRGRDVHTGKPTRDLRGG